MQAQVHAIHLILGGRLDNVAIAAATRLSRNTVGRYRSLVELKGIGPDQVENRDPEEVLALFNKPRSGGARKRMPDFKDVHKRMKTQRFTTLQSLYRDYYNQEPCTSLCYSHFVARYRHFTESLDVTARQDHIPGDCLMVDFSGDGPRLTHAVTGEVTEQQLFTAVDPATGFIFVEAVASQALPDWIEANTKMLAFYGGVPRSIITDNLKAAVTKVAAKGIPAEVQKQYAAFAQHYGTAILPARAYHARDKAAVENAVHIVQEHILVHLDKQVFHSLGEINAAIIPLLAALNDKPMQTYVCSRRERWNTLGRRAFSALPPTAYEFVQWASEQKVPRHCHVTSQKTRYSVPHALCAQYVDVRTTQAFVDIYHKGKRVARHPRKSEPGRYITDPAHLTDAIRAQAERNPEGFRKWAQETGPACKQMVEMWLGKGPAFSGLPACDALRALVHKHGTEVVERVGRQALLMPKPSVTLLKRLLGAELEKTRSALAKQPPANRNARGARDYLRSSAS